MLKLLHRGYPKKEENLQRRSKGDMGRLFIISAPSGSGKTTLCEKIIKLIPNLKLSISYTTRQPRKREINNAHYTFINEKKFKAMIDKGEFAEWARVHGNLYGTSLKRLDEIRKSGYDIILDIDVRGAIQIKRKFRNAVYIFVLPPSMDELERRLRKRMSESDNEIKKRINRAKEEISYYKSYDYVIINSSIKKALRELETIITAERLKTKEVKWI